MQACLSRSIGMLQTYNGTLCNLQSHDNHMTITCLLSKVCSNRQLITQYPGPHLLHVDMSNHFFIQNKGTWGDRRGTHYSCSEQHSKGNTQTNLSLSLRRMKHRKLSFSLATCAFNNKLKFSPQHMSLYLIRKEGDR